MIVPTYLILAFFRSFVLADTCVVYPGGYCSGIVDYPVYLKPNVTIDMMEEALTAHNIDNGLSKNESSRYASCMDVYRHWICYSTFPSCSENVSIDQLACRSICTETELQCRNLLTKFGLSELLPTCYGTVLGADYTYSTDSPCLGDTYKTLGDPVSLDEVDTPSEPSQSPTPSTTFDRCPPIMKAIPRNQIMSQGTNLTTNNGRICAGECCLQCPTIRNFYPESAFRSETITMHTCTVLSSLCCMFLLSSLFIEPSSRTNFPGYMIHHVVFGMLVFHVNQALGPLLPRHFLCRDDITTANQSNSLFCLLQGVLYMSSMFYINCYSAAYSLSLHLLLVWNRTHLSAYRWTLFICITVASFTVASVVVAGGGGGGGGGVEKAGGYKSNGVYGCTMAAHDGMGSWLFLCPLLVVSVPAYVASFWTVYEILRIQVATPARANVGSIANGVGGGGKIVHGASSGSVLVIDASGGSSLIWGKREESLVTTTTTTTMTGDVSSISIHMSSPNLHQPAIASHPAVPPMPTHERQRPLSLPVPPSGRRMTAVMDAIAKHGDELTRMKEIAKESGRPVAICLFCMVLLVFDWDIVDNAIGSVSIVGPNPASWSETWLFCVYSGKSHDECSLAIANDIPSSLMMMIGSIWLSLMGTFMCLIMGRKTWSLLHRHILNKRST